VRVPAVVDPAERGVPGGGSGPSTGPSPRQGDVAAVARGGMANLVGAVVSAATNFLLVLVVARWVDPYRAGVFFGVTSLFLMLETLLRLGGDVGTVYFVARWRALGLPERIRPGIRVALVPVAVLSTVVAVVMLVLAPHLAGLIGDDRHTAVGVLRLLAVLLPVAATYDVAIGATRGFGAMRPTVLVERIGRPAVQLLLVVIVLAAGWHNGLGAAWGLPYLAAAVAGWLSLRPLVAAVERRVTGRPGDTPVVAVARLRVAAREFWSFTLPRAVAGAAQIVLQRLDIVLVAALRGPLDAAVYTAATRFLVVGQFISQAIAAPVQPRLSAALAGADTLRARALYRVSTCWIVLISWPVFITVAVFAPVYMRLFGAHYRSGAAVVIVLAMSMLVAAAAGVVDAVVIMAGRTSWNLGTTLLAMTVNVAVDLALIPHFGIIGAAVGWCAAIVAANVVPLLLAWRGLGLHPFGVDVATACVLTAGCFGLLPLLGRVFSIGAATIGLGVGLLLFLVGTKRWYLRFHLDAVLGPVPGMLVHDLGEAAR
jgi:O-antigen/teichoic acid export membrane protein